MATDAQWIGLCCITESNRPAEWPYIAWVIRHRLAANRSGFGGRSIPAIVTAPKQFSFFNDAPSRDWGEIFEWAAAKKAAGANLDAATACAEWVLWTPVPGLMLPPTTYYYWSPQSMIPPGKLPPWDWSKLERFTVPGIDPWRFIFAKERP